MKKSNSVLVYICIIALCAFVMLPLISISVYNRPCADDYDYSILTRQVVLNSGGIFELIKAAWQTNMNFYNSWQGIYTSAFILAF